MPRPGPQVIGFAVSVPALRHKPPRSAGTSRALAATPSRPDWADLPITVDDRALGPGYAMPDAATWEAIER
jgi:hypothetical protein